MWQFDEKFYIVTGGSRGIGQAIAKKLLDASACVLIISAHEKPSWCADYQSCEHMKVNFLDKVAVDNFCEKIKTYDSIDGLVNCAGIFYSAPLAEVDEQKYNDVMRVNLSVPFQVSRAVAVVMAKNKKGRMINVGSITAIVSRPGSHAYSASKAGLAGLTRALALELAEDNILINTLCPGYTETDMTNATLTPEKKEELRLRVPLKRIASPNEIAHYALFLLSDLNTYTTGQTVVVDGGVTVM